MSDHVDITLGMPVGWLEDDPRITRQPCAPRVMRCHRCCYTRGPWHQLAPELFICVPCYEEFIRPIPAPAARRLHAEAPVSHAESYLAEVAALCAQLPAKDIEVFAANLSLIEGRVYMIGLGGSLADCGHMAADLRKLCNLDAVAPDNLAELTAWANDAEWAALFDGYLQTLTGRDALFVLSVGGGTEAVSTPICRALLRAHLVGATIFGVTGPHGGETAKQAHHVLRVPDVNPVRVTPHTEGFQAVLRHLLVSHPLLQRNKTKW